MSQTSCNCGFPLLIRWLHAGGDLSRPNSVHQRADRALIRSEHPPKRLLQSADLPCVPTRRSTPASVMYTIEVNVGIKSP